MFFQVIYELKAGGVDERRLVGAKLEKLAEGESGDYCTLQNYTCVACSICISMYVHLLRHLL